MAYLQGWQSYIYLTLSFAVFKVQELHLTMLTVQTQPEMAIRTERKQYIESCSYSQTPFTVQVASSAYLLGGMPHRLGKAVITQHMPKASHVSIPLHHNLRCDPLPHI